MRYLLILLTLCTVGCRGLMDRMEIELVPMDSIGISSDGRVLLRQQLYKKDLKVDFHKCVFEHTVKVREYDQEWEFVGYKEVKVFVLVAESSDDPEEYLSLLEYVSRSKERIDRKLTEKSKRQGWYVKGKRKGYPETIHWKEVL